MDGRMQEDDRGWRWDEGINIAWRAFQAERSAGRPRARRETEGRGRRRVEDRVAEEIGFSGQGWIVKAEDNFRA